MTKKIDNCIARKYKEVYIFRYIDEYEKANKIHISERKLIWLIQRKNVKSNFKALKL